MYLYIHKYDTSTSYNKITIRLNLDYTASLAVESNTILHNAKVSLFFLDVNSKEIKIIGEIGKTRRMHNLQCPNEFSNNK